jgi:hypothetical protein
VVLTNVLCLVNPDLTVQSSAGQGVRVSLVSEMGCRTHSILSTLVTHTHMARLRLLAALALVLVGSARVSGV